VLFRGYTLSGAQMQGLVEQALGKPLKAKGFPWLILRLLGLFSRQMRAVVAMSYLWRVPHQIDRSDFDGLLPDFKETPAEEAFEDMVRGLGKSPKSPRSNHGAGLGARSG